MSEEVFRSYLLGLGVPEDHIHATMGSEDDICGGDSVTVSWSHLDGKTFTKSELLNMEIEYTYCRIMEND